MFSAIGLHPERIDVSEDEFEETEKLIREVSNEIVAVGEIGLPYYSIRNREDFYELIDLGKPQFRSFLDLARDLDLAVVLHAPHLAAEEAFKLVNETRIQRVLFHWHKSSPEVTQNIVDRGYYISVTPEVCYESRDRNLVKSVPLSNLVLETDGPWQYENEFEGRKTEPYFVRRIAQEIALLKHITFEEVAKKTTENAINLFKLNK